MELRDLILVVSLWVTLVVGLMCGYSIHANGENIQSIINQEEN